MSHPFKHLRLSSDTLMCPQFKKLLIVIPLVSFGMEPVAEDIKTCSLGIETLLLDSSGLSCTSLCVDNSSSWRKEIFPKKCAQSTWTFYQIIKIIHALKLFVASVLSIYQFEHYWCGSTKDYLDLIGIFYSRHEAARPRESRFSFDFSFHFFSFNFFRRSYNIKSNDKGSLYKSLKIRASVCQPEDKICWWQTIK